ncbi:unnamed protein product [Pedinophyceae sp. YPF-701]|nr:unnamed protein product [Pedinophyceae sp. YPF-701]
MQGGGYRGSDPKQGSGGQGQGYGGGPSGYGGMPVYQQPPVDQAQAAAQHQLQQFWRRQTQEIEAMGNDPNEFKNHQLPLARIKKIMKSDEDVRMISAEAPVLFARACEMFILELTFRSWGTSEESKRRTLQRSDIAAAILQTDIFDFLQDIVRQDERQDLAQRQVEYNPAASGMGVGMPGGMYPMGAPQMGAGPGRMVPGQVPPAGDVRGQPGPGMPPATMPAPGMAHMQQPYGVAPGMSAPMQAPAPQQAPDAALRQPPPGGHQPPPQQ